MCTWNAPPGRCFRGRDLRYTAAPPAGEPPRDRPERQRPDRAAAGPAAAAGLVLARRRAAVPGRRVAVVAGLAVVEDAVAAARELAEPDEAHVVEVPAASLVRPVGRERPADRHRVALLRGDVEVDEAPLPVDVILPGGVRPHLAVADPDRGAIVGG